MYPNSSNTPSAPGQELLPFKRQGEVLEGVIVEGPFRLNPGGYIPRSRQPRSPLLPDHFLRAFSGFADTLTAFVESLGESLGKLAEDVAKFNEAARDAGLVPEEPPTDPRARALWMKQHRNTGPATPKDWRKR